MHPTSGRAAIRRAFLDAHCSHLHQWFDGRGRWRDAAPAPDSREQLWHAISLLSRGRPQDLRLAQAVVARTPVEYNGFAPVAAADVLLNFGQRLGPRPTRHLLDLLRQYIIYVIEFRFAAQGLMNFSAMDTFCMLAASRLLKDGYEFRHRFAAPPCVYNQHRLRDLALNSAQLLETGHSRGELTAEFNSPTYTPITLMALAKIVHAAGDDKAIADIALRAEHALWRETAAFFHPGLGVSVGPFSRAYLADLAGQVSLMRPLLAYVGVGPDRSVAALLDDPHPDLALHHLGNRPFNWGNVAWLLSTRYHLPADLADHARLRPKAPTLKGVTRWASFGRKVKGRLMPVQGDLLPGGQSDIHQHRDQQWSVGWRTHTGMTGISYPFHLHYAHRFPVRTMRDLRHLTGGVVLGDQADAYRPGAYGQPAQVDAIQFSGDVRVTGSARSLKFVAGPLRQLCVLPSREWSVNTFITGHFTPLPHVTLDGEVFTGRPLQRVARSARCVVQEGDYRYEIVYQFPRAVRVSLEPWGRFVRFVGHWYHGRRRMFTEQELRRFTMRGSFRLLAAPTGSRA